MTDDKPEPPDDGPVMGFTDEDTETAVFQAIGAASVCWDDMHGSGVFNSDRARSIAEELIAHLRRIHAIPRETS